MVRATKKAAAAAAEQVPPPPVDVDFLKHEFERLRAGLAGVKETLGESATAALDQINAHLDAAQLEALRKRLKAGGHEAVTKLETEVTARPLAAIAIAFGVGVLAAQLFRKPSA